MPFLPTPEQQKETERLVRYIKREQLYALMNDTKWRETLAAITNIPGYIPRFRVKESRSSEPAENTWDRSFPYHVPQPYMCIEWIEFDPIVRKTNGRLVAPQMID